MHGKSKKLVQFLTFLIIHPQYVEDQVWSRSRRSRNPSRSHISLRLQLKQNDLAPCGSGSAALF
jgi:hypothetical protein